MRTLTTFSAVIVLMAMSSSALAQGQRQKTYKRSCQEVCLERCKAKGPARHGLDACLSGCPGRCELDRSEKAQKR